MHLKAERERETFPREPGLSTRFIRNIKTDKHLQEKLRGQMQVNADPTLLLHRAEPVATLLKKIETISFIK